VAKDDKKKKKGNGHEDVVDLAARIGARPSQSEQTPREAGPPAEPPPPPPAPTRLDGR